MRSRVGMQAYIPELFWGDMDEEEALPFTVAIDLWSLGCVLFRLLTRQLSFGSPSSLLRYYRSEVSFPLDALNQNDVSRDGIDILSEIMKPRPSERMNVRVALLHSWTRIQEPTLNGSVPTGHPSSIKIIEEIPIPDLRLKAPAPNVGNHDNE